LWLLPLVAEDDIGGAVPDDPWLWWWWVLDLEEEEEYIDEVEEEEPDEEIWMEDLLLRLDAEEEWEWEEVSWLTVDSWS
jgi:hypothetical protein